MDSRLERAWKHFQLYLETTGFHVSGLRSFSRDKMHFSSGFQYPWLGIKASDCPVLLKWLILILPFAIADETMTAEQVKVLKWVESAATGGLHWTQSIHGHGIWLPVSCAIRLRKAIQAFQSNYAKLAQWCLVRKQSLYGLTPKLHAMSHFRCDLDSAIMQGHGVLLNPAVYDCGVSEDFVGRVSRQSRRISFKKRGFVKQLLQVYLLKTRFVITSFAKRWACSDVVPQVDTWF